MNIKVYIIVIERVQTFAKSKRTLKRSTTLAIVLCIINNNNNKNVYCFYRVFYGQYINQKVFVEEIINYFKSVKMLVYCNYIFVSVCLFATLRYFFILIVFLKFKLHLDKIKKYYDLPLYCSGNNNFKDQ